MKNKKVPELKSIAKKLGLSRYGKLRKHELIRMIQDFQDNERNSSVILDEADPKTNIQILKPTQFSAGNKVAFLKSLAEKIAKPATREINKFADWIISYVPEPIRNTVNERVDTLKNDVKKIFAQAETFEPKQKQTAFNEYLKSYRISGVEGYDPKTFIMNIKLKVFNLIKQQKKPINLRFIFTRIFIKENPATGQIDESFGYFHSFVEVVTEGSNASEIFNAMTARFLELTQEFQNEGSGWQFKKVESLDIFTDPFKPLTGSSYIPLPNKIADKKAIINSKNKITSVSSGLLLQPSILKIFIRKDSTIR